MTINALAIPASVDARVGTTVDDLRGARCKGSGLWWTKVEAASAVARSESSRQYAASPALELCATCPVRDACAAWAAEARYSGIAGGQVLHDGQPLTDGRRRVIELVGAA